MRRETFLLAGLFAAATLLFPISDAAAQGAEPGGMTGTIKDMPDRAYNPRGFPGNDRRPEVKTRRAPRTEPPIVEDGIPDGLPSEDEIAKAAKPVKSAPMPPARGSRRGEKPPFTWHDDPWLDPFERQFGASGNEGSRIPRYYEPEYRGNECPAANSSPPPSATPAPPASSGATPAGGNGAAPAKPAPPKS